MTKRVSQAVFLNVPAIVRALFKLLRALQLMKQWVQKSYFRRIMVDDLMSTPSY